MGGAFFVCVARGSELDAVHRAASSTAATHPHVVMAYPAWPRLPSQRASRTAPTRVSTWTNVP